MSSLEISPEVVISVRNVWAGYDGDNVLQDVNLEVQAGDFVGLIGPNGGGKTTLLRVLLGLLPVTRGEVRVMGKPVRAGRRHVGYVPQVVEFDHDFPISVWDVARMGRLGKRGLFKRYTREDDEIVAEALEKVGMARFQRRAIGELSGGQRQRVYIARALAQEPDILFLDEPTANIDSESTTSIYELLSELNERATILLISHDLTAISSYVRTVGCVSGKVYYHGDKQITQGMIDQAYHCPVDLIAHGVPHRVFGEHLAHHHHHDHPDHDEEAQR